MSAQALALVLGTGSAQIAVAALYILSARAMTPEEFGPIVTAIGLGVAGSGFLDLGANLYWIRELASHRITQSDLDIRMSTRIVLAFAIGGSILLVAYLVEPTFMAAGVLLFTMSTVQTVLVPLRAVQRAQTVGWLIFLGRVVAVATFFGYAATGVNAGTALWVSLAVGDLALLGLALAVTRPADRLRFTIKQLRNPWAGTRWYGVFTLSTSAQQLDLPVVAALSGPAGAGIYGAVNRWIQPMLLAIGAFSSAAVPIMAAEKRLTVLRRKLLRASWILLLAITISLATFIFAPWLVTTLLGSQFEDAVTVLRLLALAMVLNAFTQPMVMLLQTRRRDHLAAGIMLAAVLSQLTAVVALASSLGALSAGIGMLAGQSIALIGTAVSIAFIARRRRRNAQ